MLVSGYLMWMYHLKAITGQCCISLQTTLQSTVCIIATKQYQDPGQWKFSASIAHCLHPIAYGWSSVPESACEKDGKKKEEINCYVSLPLLNFILR